jgi:hypothetical protein
VARPISSLTERVRRTDGLARLGLVVAALALVQAAVFYDHFAVALTFLFGLGLGLWLRSWTAGLWALAAFVPAYLIAVATGWLHDARPISEPLLGGALAVAGGLIGGGIFELLRRDAGARAPAAHPADPF